METFRMGAIDVCEQPLKVGGEATIGRDELERDARHIAEVAEPVRPDAPGTCIDERVRAGLYGGDTETEARYANPGGPDIYGLYMAELTGYFGDSEATGKERLVQVKSAINAGGITSGGHVGCAANAGFNAVMGLIAGGNAEAGCEYAKENLGDDFDEEAYNEVVENAKRVAKSGLYDEWSEDVLLEVLGDEADKGMELLEGQHEGLELTRFRGKGKTPAQNKIFEKTGRYSFVNHEDRAEQIEAIIADGPNAAWSEKLARHAREALLAALVPALPNPELHQLNVQV